ncbi:DUF1554 domain-containing protein [Nannocystis sp. SCPEA4]|uniref:DUF1554 domain-containing protein n=1 Tax=Nannocystis sp. SCPEA4 TaxID=2996787 RepID=UPI00226FAE18|nr:DUF1554 domain-containing protein [Nannocystis sp. SCPEA4]MCY1057302.1 DUF1554 domain-containing protein [Nannocystis sp. SCPEA4]
MSRIRLLLPSALLVGGCVAPGLKYIDPPPETTTTGDSSTSGDGSTTIMTTTESSADEGTDSGHGASDGSQSTTTGADSSSGGVDTTTTGTTGAADPVCGDGLVEGDEECDDANDIADDRCDGCTKNRWIFASAAFHNDGDIGGIEGADSRCRQYALQSGKADDSWKTFIAWLSDADHDVRDRLYPGRGRYVRTDGIVVAETVEQFFSGSLAAPINVDEHGNQDIGGGVLTGTKPDGTAAPGTHCDNWTSSSLSDHSAYEGNASSITQTWTMFPDDPPLPCTALSARLYCIEGE